MIRPSSARASEEAEERDAERAALEARLLEGAEEGRPRRLLGHLVDYHQREARRSGGRGSAGRSSTTTS